MSSWLKFRSLFFRPKLHSELDEELRYHVERQIEQNIAAGMSPQEARFAALREFGSVTLIGETCRDAWGFRLVETFLQDLRYSTRLLLKNPGFAAAAIFTIALGLAATTSIFSVVYAVMLRPLPYPDPGRLINLWTTNSRLNQQHDWISAANYRDWRAQNTVFEDIALVRDIGNFNLTGEGEPERLSGARVSINLLRVLGVPPVLGRGFQPGDDNGRADVVLLSDRLWKRRFGADPGITGKTIRLNGSQYVVAGVMGPDFRYPSRQFELWVPLTINPVEYPMRLPYSYLSIGRLKPGISLERAQLEMDAIAARLASQYGVQKGSGIHLTPLQQDIARPVQSSLYVFLAAVLGLLLIACANLSSLLVARALSRKKELAVRLALGAGKARLVAQCFTELIPILAIGGLAGLLATTWLLRALIPSLPQSMPRIDEIEVNTPILGFSIAVLLFTAVLAGVWPAMFAAQTIGSGAPRGSSSNRGTVRLRRLLVSAQIAIAVVLLTGASLLLRSFAAIRTVDPGFRAGHVLSVHLAIPRSKYLTDAAVAAFCKRVLDRVSTLPGVVSAGMVNRLPLAGGVQNGPLRFEGVTAPPDSLGNIEWRTVTPDYFQTMGIPLLQGRSFSESDLENAAAVGILDERAARLVWPNENPIGKRMQIPIGDSPWMTVIGIVGHVHNANLSTGGGPQAYWNYWQKAQDRMALVVRTSLPPQTITAGVTSAIRAVDPDQPVYDVFPMEEVVERSLADRWLNTFLITTFATLSLLLTAIGIYGVMAYIASQRTLEIGIRLALGAQRAQILGLIARQGLGMLAAGTTLGLLGSIALGGFLRTLLFGVPSLDWLSYTMAALVITAAALIACYLPARRSSRIAPVSALRTD